MNREWIDKYAAGGLKLRQAVVGLSRVDLAAFPVPGTWSIHQVVIHLMDSDLIGTDRMKRIIAEDNPQLMAYDETRFVNSLCYHDQSVEDAITIFDLNRRNFVNVLRKLPDAAFERTGNHSEVGTIKLGVQVQKYVEHLDHHLKFVHEKRAKLGKPLRFQSS